MGYRLMPLGTPIPESYPFWASLLANVGWLLLTTPQHTFTGVHHSHLLGGDSHVWLATYRHSIPLSTFENQSPAEGRGCHSRTREERSCTFMNTQLLRYTVLNEHVTFPLIPPAYTGFRANGSHQGRQPDRASARVSGGQARFGARFPAKVIITHTRGGLRPSR
jgi:hypothetical protein